MIAETIDVNGTYGRMYVRAILMRNVSGVDATLLGKFAYVDFTEANVLCLLSGE